VSLHYFSILISLSEAKMRTRRWLIRRVMLCNLLGLILSGCGGPPEIVAISSDERGLKELSGIYRDFTSKSKRPPKTLKELNVKGQQNPIAVTMIKSGDLMVEWGAPLTPEGEVAHAILAYLKKVPEQGGNVLMQDGKTIKMMTADEFKAAPKASPR
jgi:hypothetical protein